MALSRLLRPLHVGNTAMSRIADLCHQSADWQAGTEGGSVLDTAFDTSKKERRKTSRRKETAFKASHQSGNKAKVLSTADLRMSKGDASMGSRMQPPRMHPLSARTYQ